MTPRCGKPDEVAGEVLSREFFRCRTTAIVAVLHEGRPADTDGPDDLPSGDRLGRIYGLKFAVERLPAGRPVPEPLAVRRYRRFLDQSRGPTPTP